MNQLIGMLMFVVGILGAFSPAHARVPAFVVPEDRPLHDSIRDMKIRVFGVPLVFFSLDTRWGFGGGGILTFPGRPLRSSITFSASYTQRKQLLLSFPFQWYWRSQLRLNGELGWYHYLYQFFGVGNRYPDDFIELYTAQYPRFRLNATYALGGRQFAGLRYSLDAYHIVEHNPDGLIGQKLVPGAAGGFSSGFGPVWIFDSRDNQFFPWKGMLAEVSVVRESARTGSDFNYWRFSGEAAWYKTLDLQRHIILATQVAAQFTRGDPPFFMMPQLGGNRRLRGYLSGKYRDRHAFSLQTECRFPIYWRVKGVAFASLGGVWGTPGEAMTLRPDGGGGLRIEFDRKQRIHLRIDYARGSRGNQAYYVTLGEAF